MLKLNCVIIKPHVSSPAFDIKVTEQITESPFSVTFNNNIKNVCFLAFKEKLDFLLFLLFKQNNNLLYFPRKKSLLSFCKTRRKSSGMKVKTQGICVIKGSEVDKSCTLALTFYFYDFS